jgi:hypothetical protein
MWKNTAEAGRPQATIWRMRIAEWIPKATYTLSEYVKPVAFHCNNGYTSTSILGYTNVACLVIKENILKLVSLRTSVKEICCGTKLSIAHIKQIR